METLTHWKPCIEAVALCLVFFRFVAEYLTAITGNARASYLWLTAIVLAVPAAGYAVLFVIAQTEQTRLAMVALALIVTALVTPEKQNKN